VKTFRFGVLVAVSVALAGVSGGSAAAAGSRSLGKPVAFHATYSGIAASKVTGSVVDVRAAGTGSGTLLGASKVSGNGTGNSANPPCVPFTGPGFFTGSGGKLDFTVLSGSMACGDSADNQYAVSGLAKFAGGTGKYASATGTLKFTGSFTRSSGAFKATFTGSLSP